MKATKIVFYISTGLLSLMMAMSAGMYLFNTEEVTKVFEASGHPAHVIYPLAFAKILGIAAIWANKSQTIKTFAYAGFTFNFLLAILAHLNAGDGEAIGAGMALVLLATSFFTGRKIESLK